MRKDIFSAGGTKNVIDCIMQKKNPRVSDIASLCGFGLSKTRAVLYALCDIGLVEKKEASRGHAARYAIRSDATAAVLDVRAQKPRLFLYSILNGDYTEISVEAVGKRRPKYTYDEILGLMKTYTDKKIAETNTVCAAIIEGNEKSEEPLWVSDLRCIKASESELVVSLISSAVSLESFAVIYDDGEKGRLIYAEKGKVVCTLDTEPFRENAAGCVEYLSHCAVLAARMFHTNTVFVSSAESDADDCESIRKICLETLSEKVNVITSESGLYDILKAAVRKSLGLI